jgi:hypothetical protein
MQQAGCSASGRHERRSLACTGIVVALSLWATACDRTRTVTVAGPPGGPGEGGAVDRSGTWTFTLRADVPCPGEEADEVFSVSLVQDGTVLTGTRCADGQLETYELRLAGANLDQLDGVVSGCESLNGDCQAPFGECGRVLVVGSIEGRTVAGTWRDEAGTGCGSTGTFIATIG